MQHESFLPDEYVEHRRNRRTSYLVMAMFLVVVASIGGAFLHRHLVLQDALQRQENALSRYETAAEQVQLITELEESRDEMIVRAILASALVERVPRSVLLADIIDRMPEGLSLVELDLTSTLVQQPRTPPATGTGRPPRRPGRGAACTVDSEETFAVPRYSVRLALEGLTSFSVSPLRWATLVGLLAASVGGLFGVWIVAKAIMLGDPTDGYPSLIALISFLGGIQLVSVGIVGEYVGKTYIESKQRPLYLTEEVVENKEVSSRDQISNFRGVKNAKAI